MLSTKKSGQAFNTNGGEALPENDVSTVECEIAGWVNGAQQGIDDDQVLCPWLESCVLIQKIEKNFVKRDDNLWRTYRRKAWNNENQKLLS